MIKTVPYSSLANYKPQKPVRIVEHTYLQALEKTLDLMAIGHAFKYKCYDPNKEKLTLDLLIKLCKAFNQQGIEYMIGGGIAVGFYELTRLSRPSKNRPDIKSDIDIWYRPSLKNRLQIVESLKSLSFTYSENDTNEMTLFSDPKREDRLMINQSNFKLDFIPYSKGLRFETSVKTATIIELAGVKIPFIGYDELIKTK